MWVLTPQNEGIKIICKTWKFIRRQPIPTHYLLEMPRIILKENFLHFNGKHYLQTEEKAIGTKTAVFFANIFMAYIETTTPRGVPPRILDRGVPRRFVNPNPI